MLPPVVNVVDFDFDDECECEPPPLEAWRDFDLSARALSAESSFVFVSSLKRVVNCGFSGEASAGPLAAATAGLAGAVAGGGGPQGRSLDDRIRDARGRRDRRGGGHAGDVVASTAEMGLLRGEPDPTGDGREPEHGDHELALA